MGVWGVHNQVWDVGAVVVEVDVGAVMVVVAFASQGDWRIWGADGFKIVRDVYVGCKCG